MKKRGALGFAAAAVSLVLALACATKKDVAIDATKLRLFGALPAVMESATNPITEEKVTLGRILYYDTRLSKGHDVACNTCHELEKWGADEESITPGHKGLKGNRNSPTVYNAAGHFVQFWDGRAPDVEEQAKGPVLNPVEMAMPNEKHVLVVLNSMPEYVALFEKAFPGEKGPVTYTNMVKAIGAFERKLTTPARWDKFVQGDAAALTEAEKAGFNKYMELGCQACHSGVYVGGSMYQKLGAVKPWPKQEDLGRFHVTKQESDRMLFKVPSLRNIEKTGPYYHDGSIPTLELAVSNMAEYQLGKTPAAEEVASVVTWLKSLTGERPLDYIKRPELPKSTARTPKPDKS